MRALRLGWIGHPEDLYWVINGRTCQITLERRPWY